MRVTNTNNFCYKEQHQKSDLGATWSKGSWYSKNNTFLTAKQLGKIHFVSWRSFIQRYCRQLVTDLYIIITSITLHYYFKH